jgi:hypothetical protein
MIAVVFRGEIAAREHQQLLECALVRDWKKAQSVLVAHIEGCVEHALREDNAGVFGKPPKSAASTLTANANNTVAAGAKTAKAAVKAAPSRRNGKP